MTLVENTILFSYFELGIKNTVDKINLKVSYPWDDEWFHEFHNIVSIRGRSCMYCFQFISEKEYLHKIKFHIILVKLSSF